MRVGIFAFDRGDANQLEKYFKDIKFKVNKLNKGIPSNAEIQSFFKHSYDILFLGGHSDGDKRIEGANLENHNYKNDLIPNNVELQFSDNDIQIYRGADINKNDGKPEVTLKKGTADLPHISKISFVFLLGCNTLHHRENVIKYRNLFDDPGMVGFKSKKNPRSREWSRSSINICRAVFGFKPYNNNICNFFYYAERKSTSKNKTLIKKDQFYEDPNHLCRSWLKSALNYHKGNEVMTRMFAAVDTTGQRWEIRSNNKIVRGFKV